MSWFKQEFDRLGIPSEDILQATNKFAPENLIAKGGFGNVYHGEILQPKGMVMCVFKRLHKAYGQGNPEFWKEVMMLSRCRHENIVSLVGFCNDGRECVLVYEFQTYGSLDKYLSSSKLTWFKRLLICLGAAQGLNYLHTPRGVRRRVIHRDIKSSNILLDKNWQAKLADFGLSKRPLDQQYNYLVNPYVDPLYMERGILTMESDIYSFGVVLFEVLCSRLATTNEDGPARFLSHLARQHYKKGTITNIIDPLLRKQMNPDSMKTFTTIAYQCLENDRFKRPTISEIVKKLKKSIGSSSGP